MDGSKTTAHEARPASGIILNNKPSPNEEGGVGCLTLVESVFTAKRCHHRVILGESIRRVLLTRRRGHLRVQHEFPPGRRFVLDLWRRNDYGTLQWRCYVCESVGPGEHCERVPFVTPGARILLSTQGVAQSKAFLAWLYDLKYRGIDPLRCPAATFEAAHFRLGGTRTNQLGSNTLSGVL